MKISVKIQIISLLFLIAVASAFSLNLMSVIEGYRVDKDGNKVFRSQSERRSYLNNRRLDTELYLRKKEEEEKRRRRSELGLDDFQASSTSSSIQSYQSAEKSLMNKTIVESNNEEICGECKDPVSFNLQNDDLARAKFNCSVDINASAADQSNMIYRCNKYMFNDDNPDVLILCRKCSKYSFTVPKTSLEKKWYKMMEERNEKVTSMITDYMDETLGNEMSVKQAGDELKKLVSQPLGGHDAQGACGDTSSCHFKEVHHDIYPNQYDVGVLGCAIEEQLE